MLGSLKGHGCTSIDPWKKILEAISRLVGGGGMLSIRSYCALVKPLLISWVTGSVCLSNGSVAFVDHDPSSPQIYKVSYIRIPKGIFQIGAALLRFVVIVYVVSSKRS